MKDVEKLLANATKAQVQVADADNRASAFVEEVTADGWMVAVKSPRPEFKDDCAITQRSGRVSGSCKTPPTKATPPVPRPPEGS